MRYLRNQEICSQFVRLTTNLVVVELSSSSTSNSIMHKSTFKLRLVYIQVRVCTYADRVKLFAVYILVRVVCALVC